MSGRASAIYYGRVRHRRFAVRPREFSHPVAMAYIDLDELPRLNGGRLLRRFPGITRFRRSDYFGDPREPLAQAIRSLVHDRTGRVVQGPVRLLTNLRSFGHCFNPVSFYYCFDGDERLIAVVAHVTNTPWGERQAYVITDDSGDDTPRILHGETGKLMHVSPFMGMDQRYQWTAAIPGPSISVHIESRQDGHKVFDATLGLPRRRPLTRRGLVRLNLRFPAATLRNIALIYGHAIVLRLRNVPWHSNPGSKAAA